MSRHVTTILALQEDLAARARQFTADTNEASFMVGRVMCRALGRFKQPAAKQEISQAMLRDLEAMIERARRSRH